MGGEIALIASTFNITFGASTDVSVRCREYFNNTREPFLITLAGQKLAILTSPHDIAAIWKNTESLSLDVFLKDVYVAFGVSSDVAHKMYQTPSELPWSGDAEKQTTMFRSENPLHKSLGHLQSDFFKLQLHPGEKLDSLGVKFMRHINRHLQWKLKATMSCRRQQILR